MELKKMHWMGIVAAAVIVIVDVIFFRSDQRMMLFLFGISAGIAILPFIIGLALDTKKEDKLNEMFLDFTRNLAESVATGTPISKGIINMKKNNYGVLNPYVSKLANQIELGIPVDKAMENFGADIDSTVVKRAISLIREAEKAGGEIDYILDSTAKSISEVEKLKKERKAAIYNLVVQGYIIFFIFIGIILVMEFKILPLTAGIQNIGGLSGDLNNFQDGGTTEQQSMTPEDFATPFLYLILAQGFFVGLVIGKLSEGSLKKGLKHSFILMIVAFLVSTGARVFLG